VAIVGVDEGLHSIDFRAEERLAQLVVQVAGRAGRARKPGRVLLQTHQPEHPLLRNLLARGYAATAADLLDERRKIQLPPYSHQVLLRADAPQREHVDTFLRDARALLPELDALQIAGPMQAPMPLRAGRPRGQLLLESTQRSVLRAMLRPWQHALFALPSARRVRWSLDVDPIDLYLAVLRVHVCTRAGHAHSGVMGPASFFDWGGCGDTNRYRQKRKWPIPNPMGQDGAREFHCARLGMSDVQAPATKPVRQNLPGWTGGSHSHQRATRRRHPFRVNYRIRRARSGNADCACRMG
jgi:hypothetical protein